MTSPKPDLPESPSLSFAHSRLRRTSRNGIGRIIFPYALVMAGVGLIESLLTLNVVDEIKMIFKYGSI